MQPHRLPPHRPTHVRPFDRTTKRREGLAAPDGVRTRRIMIHGHGPPSVPFARTAPTLPAPVRSVRTQQDNSAAAHLYAPLRGPHGRLTRFACNPRTAPAHEARRARAHPIRIPNSRARIRAQVHAGHRVLRREDPDANLVSNPVMGSRPIRPQIRRRIATPPPTRSGRHHRSIARRSPDPAASLTPAAFVAFDDDVGSRRGGQEAGGGRRPHQSQGQGTGMLAGGSPLTFPAA